MTMNPTSRTSFGELAPGTGSARMNSAHGYPSFGKSIPETTSSSTWKGGIWGNVPAIGTGAKSSSIDTSRSQAVTPNSPDYVKGSGSLLPSSELDPWTRQKGITTWPLSELSSELSLGIDGSSHMSTIQRTKVPSSSPFLSIAQPAPIRDTSSNKSRSQSFLDPTLSNNSFTSSYDQHILDQVSRHHSDEAIRHPANSVSFGNHDVAPSNAGRSVSNGVTYSGYNSGAASRSGSVPRTRNGYSSQGPQFSLDCTSEYGENNQFHNSDLYPSRPSHSSRPSTYSTNGFRKYSEQVSPMHPPDFAASFGKLNIGKENQLNHEAPYSPIQQHSNPHQWSHNSTGGIANGIPSRSNQFSYDQTSRHTSYPTRSQKIQYRDLPSYSPNAGDFQRSHNSHNSPFFSTNGTPPLQKNGRSQSNGSQRSVPHLDNNTNYLTMKLQSLAQEQNTTLHMNNPYLSQQNINHQQHSFAPPRSQYNSYDYANQGIPRYPHQQLQQLYELQMEGYQMGRNMPPDHPNEMAVAETIRSTLLEDFRGSHKNQRRWELKDLYNHFVEFSGDQHGSRFIQQKLETANSDDKEQIFQEILPNSLQLMTDVFGNYVTQKLFEHGSQAQKKVLAAQMKGHVYDLSLQMYGCRVVQKAFEHILRDQQASLVKELESHVLKCVKDQNGNHVIQKAIERIPAEYIPFILNAFTGQVHALSTHPYGCRVIQRMLEHCKQPARGRLLDELHLCASSLITDQYGNYVTQHMIEYGGEEDKARVIDIINDALIVLSKHKFASNVVEKSIGLGTEEQRQRIANILSLTDDKGESPLQLVMRDAYGNYVVQKLLAKLEGPFATEFAQKARVQIQLAKRFSYGKQLGVIEKIISELLERNRLELKLDESSSPTHLDTSTVPPTSTPPLLSEDAQSPQTSSLPSTRSSTIEGPIGMQKTIGTSTIEVETSTTPIPRSLRDDLVT